MIGPKHKSYTIENVFSPKTFESHLSSCVENKIFKMTISVKQIPFLK